MKQNMWKKPWRIKEGAIIGGIIVIIGLLLQLSMGPVVWSAFAWPNNGIAFAAFLMIIVVIFLLKKKVYLFHYLGTYQAAIPALAYAVTLTLVMGLTKQTEGSTWLNSMLTFWPFVLTYMYMTTVLGLVVLNRLQHRRGLKDIPFYLNHLGLFIALTTATLGNADMQQLKMVVGIGMSEWRGITQEGIIKELPMSIELKRFILETYEDGSPKRYASEVEIVTSDDERIQTTIDVNKPAKVDGWKIYQYSYDTQMGKQSQTSTLELVSDPWLPLVYAGIYMMLAGAVSMLLFGQVKKS